MYNHLTGHIYYMSAHECDDNCGTCDGGKCDTCKTVYTVNGVEGVFYNKQEAQDAEDAVNSLIIKEPDVTYGDLYENRFFIEDGKLFVNVWVHKKGEYMCDKNFECNAASPAYAEKLKEIEEKYVKYNECKCTNKDTADDGECKKHGCVDSSCYYQMKNGKRTEKKWYM